MDQTQITQTRRQRKPNQSARVQTRFAGARVNTMRNITTENAETSRHAIKLRMKN
jgi:hypothetical protein